VCTPPAWYVKSPVIGIPSLRGNKGADGRLEPSKKVTFTSCDYESALRTPARVPGTEWPAKLTAEGWNRRPLPACAKCAAVKIRRAIGGRIRVTRNSWLGGLDSNQDSQSQSLPNKFTIKDDEPRRGSKGKSKTSSYEHNYDSRAGAEARRSSAS
jgi:hypothetical protein